MLNDTINVAIKGFFSLLFLFFVIKLLGKKQISQLNVFDYVIGISLGNIAAEMTINEDITIINAFVAMAIYGLCSLFVSYITNKSILARRFISGVPIILIEHGNILERPKAPTKEGFTFGGWYVEPDLNYSYDFEGPVEGDFTLFARWIDNDDLKDYTVTSEDGNIISFTDEEGHDYKLSIFDILSLSKEEIMAMDEEITEEYYNQIMDLLNSLASKTGELLKLYEIEVYEDNNVTNDITNLHEGPFQIKIKITDDMKKYDTFKLVYLKNDFTLGEVVELVKEGDYLVGTLPHLSTYMLTGSNKEINPSTYDNIMFYTTLLTISTIGLIGIKLYTRKKDR